MFRQNKTRRWKLGVSVYDNIFNCFCTFPLFPNANTVQRLSDRSPIRIHDFPTFREVNALARLLPFPLDASSAKIGYRDFIPWSQKLDPSRDVMMFKRRRYAK
jgi:hypothetical protein